MSIEFETFYTRFRPKVEFMPKFVGQSTEILAFGQVGVCAKSHISVSIVDEWYFLFPNKNEELMSVKTFFSNSLKNYH
jgi:hypothetical protein